MGKIMIEYYENAKSIGGMKAVMRMTLLTKISTVKAASEPDTDENIEKFKKAIEEIKKDQ